MSFGLIQVKMGDLALRAAQLDHLVRTRLSQISGQVDVHATKFGKVLALLGILPCSVFQPKLGLESLLLPSKMVLGFVHAQFSLLLFLIQLELVEYLCGLLMSSFAGTKHLTFQLEAFEVLSLLFGGALEL